MSGQDHRPVLVRSGLPMDFTSINAGSTPSGGVERMSQPLALWSHEPYARIQFRKHSELVRADRKLLRLSRTVLTSSVQANWTTGGASNT